MKKVIFSLFFVLFTFSLFCSSTKSNSVKKFHNSLYSLDYELHTDSDGITSLTISAESGLDMKIKVLCSDPSQALDFMMSVEDKLQEGSSRAIVAPIKSLIDIIKEDYDNYSWGQGSDTGDFYFLLDLTNDIQGDAQGPITLTVLDCPDAIITYKQNTAIWNSFEKTHPNIKIEREVCTFNELEEKAFQYVNSGNVPDVFYMLPSGRPFIIHEYGLAKDLTPFLKKDGIYDDYVATSFLPSLHKSGYPAAIPYGMTITSCLYANTKLLSELGLKPATTYAELKKQAPILRRANRQLIVMANKDSWVMQSCLFSLVVGRLAGMDWADNIVSGKSKFTDKPFLSAVEMIKTMYDDGVLSQQTLSTSYEDAPNLFASGEGAYFVDGLWRSSSFTTDYSTGLTLIHPIKQDSDFEFLMFPALPGEVIHNSTSGALNAGYGMSSAIKDGSAKEAAAWELIKWLAGPEVQQIRFEAGASFPSLKKGIAYEDRQPFVSKRIEYYSKPSSLTPIFDGYFSVDLANVINEKLWELGRGEVTPMQVCQALQQAYEEESL